MRPSTAERMRILVTGATGPFGAHFAQHCLSRGHEVFSIRHRQRPHDSASLLKIADKITWSTGDVRNADFLAHLLAQHEIQAVAHFAALPLVRVATLVAEPIFSVNAMGTVALLDAVKQVAAKRRIHFLQVSTDKVYGPNGDQPYVEDTPLRGSSVYEASKIAAEVACRAYQAHGLVPHLVISRCCNIIAPADLNWRLVGNTCRQFLSGAPARVYTRGQYLREFIHCRDAVEALFTLLMRADEFPGQAFNVGSGVQKSQEEVIDFIKRKHFPDGNVVRVEPPDHHFIEIGYQMLDCAKIKRELGWLPKRTFEEAIADVVGWWREHAELAPWSLL